MSDQEPPTCMGSPAWGHLHGVTRMKNGMEMVPHVGPRTTHLHGVTCVWCIPTVMIKVMGHLSKLYEHTLLPVQIFTTAMHAKVMIKAWSDKFIMGSKTAYEADSNFKNVSSVRSLTQHNWSLCKHNLCAHHTSVLLGPYSSRSAISPFSSIRCWNIMTEACSCRGTEMRGDIVSHALPQVCCTMSSVHTCMAYATTLY